MTLENSRGSIKSGITSETHACVAGFFGIANIVWKKEVDMTYCRDMNDVAYMVPKC